MHKHTFRAAALSLLSVLMLVLAGCDGAPPESSSGVKRATPPQIAVDPKTGVTVEQDAVGDRLLRDNTPGSVKHLYVVSVYTGQIIAYSTVDGKVISSGKRLTGKDVPEVVFSGDSKRHQGFRIIIGAEIKATTEILGDDGTYGSSIWYLYWFDKNDRYHQHFPTDDQVLHISDTPVAFRYIRSAVDLDNMPKLGK